MGARARRRLVIASVAVSVIVGAVVVFVVAWSGSASHDGKESQPSKEVYGTFGAFGVAYGVRPSQLLKRFGAPDQKRNGCWIYRIGDTFRGIKLNPQTAGMDAVRYCFYSGVLAIIEDHWPPGVRNHLPSGAWYAPMTYGCGGGPCSNRV
jgi:hypothetical protein